MTLFSDLIYFVVYGVRVRDENNIYFIGATEEKSYQALALIKC